MKKSFYLIYLLIAVMVLMSNSIASAGVTGRLKGKVIDKTTHEPLAGATVRINGTQLETSSDANGEFYFIAVDAGTYAVSCSSNSYGDHTITETVVFTDQVSNLVFELLPLTEDIEKQSSRFQPSDIQSKSPFTISALTRSDISKLPVNSVDGIILSSTGSIYSRNERSAYSGNSNYWFGININFEGSAEYKEAAVTGVDNLHTRGGADNELGYYMDGLMLNDPFTGKVLLNLPFYAVDHVSVHTGGFSASNGNFASGIANITPRRAGNRISVSGQYTTDAAASLFGASSFGNRLYSLSASGPVVTQRLKFYLAVDLSTTDDADPSYSGNARYQLSANGRTNSDPAILDTAIFGKFKKGPRPFDVNAQSVQNLYANLTFNPTSSLQLDATALHSFRKRNIYFTEYLLAPDRVPHQERSTFNLGFSAKYIVNPNLFTRAAISYYSTNYQLMERSLFDKGSDAVFLLNSRIRGNTNATTYYGDNLLFDINRGFIPYQKTSSDYVSAQAGIAWQYDEYNFLETGVDLRQHTIQSASILDVGNPVAGSNNIYGYDIDTSGSHFKLKRSGSSGLNGIKKPKVTAFYIQDRFDIWILQMYGGFRYESFELGTKILKNPSNPTGADQILNEDDYKSGSAITKWSPRFGAAVEAFPGLIVRSNYGLYYQVPNYHQYYVNSDFLERMSIAPPYNTVVGNSALKPFKNESYEIGLNYGYQDIFKLNVSRYWKDGSRAPIVIPVTSFPNALYTPVNVIDSETDGWDFMMESQMSQNLRIKFRLGIVESMHDYASYNSGFRAAWLGYDDIHYLMPPRYWKGSNFGVSLNYYLNKHEGMLIGGVRPFENMSFCVVYTETSGSLYTPTVVTKFAVAGAPVPKAISRRNSGRVPNRQNVDVKITKNFMIVQKYQVSTYFLITNILNTKNAANVFTSTGLTNDDGFLNTSGSSYMTQREIEQYYINLKDNFNLEPPRQVSMGLTIDF